MKYFSGLYKRSFEDLWIEVIDYIDDHYGLDEIETTYLAGGCADWIKEGLNWLPRPKYVLKATGYLLKMWFYLWKGVNE